MSAQDPPAPPTSIPWMGLLAVLLLGTFISTLTTRLSSFGVADIRGAVHAGFDEGAWITTAQTVGQMLVAPLAIWLGGVYGPRRMLIYAAAAMAIVSVIEPFSPNHQGNRQAPDRGVTNSRTTAQPGPTAPTRARCRTPRRRS
jgi:MFS transporter, DHA2 family, multidrug resistance protein